MDYSKELAELRQKINWNKADADVTKIEQYHREIRNELMLKREQVPQLKKDLQTANGKIFELNRELERTKSLLKESQFNFTLSLKKSTSLEEKMKEMNDTCMNLKLKEEMRLSEVQILKEKLQKIEYENLHLNEEVKELTDKLRFSCAFQNELEDKQASINSLITKIKEGTDECSKEQMKITKIDENQQSLENFQIVSEQLMEENEKLRKECTYLENGLIECTAKYETLENFIQMQIKPKQEQRTMMEKIRFLQWEDRYRKLESKNKQNEEALATVVGTLKKEVKTNVHLLQKNDEYKIRIEELELQFNNSKMIKEEPFCVIQIDE